MTKQTLKQIDSKGRETVWEWEETPALTAFKKQQEALRLQDAALGYDTEGK